MKKHFFSIAILIMFIVGLSVLLYPAISDYLNSKHASKVISEYNDKLSVSSEEEIEAVFKKAEDYNKRLHDSPSAFFEPSLVSGYKDTLDITGTGIMGYIDIDRINVELPIYHGISKELLQVGVGHLTGTSLPVGGESTHCVLSGHRGLPSAKLFTDLDELEIGDTFTITILDRRFTYEVDQIKTVLPEEFDDLRIADGKDYCTLLTCTPYGINTHRLLVRGVRTENTEEKKIGVFVKNEAFRIDPLIVAPIAAVPLLIITFTLIFISDKRQRKKTKK
ncbi:class C sortase [Ruminococcus flavefaciens]|jgi:sortase A|uniref:class C sortase n=1 Tax=Ruminococcus flavefaciens TaxID=1265 RepID=UPI0013DAAB7B|nr:class C sortase [Ruminococcus flavefaciens]